MSIQNRNNFAGMQVWKFIYRYLSSLKGQFFLYLLLAFLSVIFTLGTVLSLKNFLELLFSGETLQAKEIANPDILHQGTNWLYSQLLGFGKNEMLLIFTIILFSLYVLKNLCSFLSTRMMVSLRAKIVRNLRNSLFAKTLRLPLSFYGSTRKGDMLSRFSNDVLEFDESVLKSCQQILIAAITVVLYFIVLFGINAKLTLFVLILLPLSGGLIASLSRRLRKSSSHMQQKTAFITSLVEETIGGLRIIKAFTAIDFVNTRFRRYNESYTRLRTSIYRRVDMASPLSDFLGNAIVIVILLFGSKLVLDPTSNLTPELFIVYIILFALNLNPVKDISTGFYNLKKGKAYVEKFEKFFATDEVIYDNHQIMNSATLNEEIKFKNVCFSYDNNIPVLDHINLVFPKGKTIALVGPSGAGKSTLVDLVARFYDCTSGEILIDDKNIKEVSLQSLRKLIGFVSQDTILFNDTVMNNIALGMPDATEEQVIQAAKISNAHEFIMQMKKGYQTIIGEKGGKLSGGQRQRISIARAVLCNPEIFILDEATSALDNESERLVQDALYRVAQNRTAIIIAHRLSTIKQADQIVVLDKGKIIQQGSHVELIQQEGLYKKLSTMQSV